MWLDDVLELMVEVFGELLLDASANTIERIASDKRTDAAGVRKKIVRSIEAVDAVLLLVLAFGISEIIMGKGTAPMWAVCCIAIPAGMLVLQVGALIWLKRFGKGRKKR